MLKTAICDLFGIKYPIIQGGMAHVATAELVSAVSNAGGLGIIGAGASESDWVREQIRLTRQQTDKPFGVNILLISPFAEQVIDVVLEEKVAMVTTGAGNPGPYIPRFKEVGIKVVPVVASVALARRLERAGADAFVAEGMESGGEIGQITTMALVPQVVDRVQAPVVAAGGIADGRGLAAALALGAQGVQMGTRFVCSQECIAHPAYKQAIVDASDRSTIISGQSTGYPLRSLENKLTREFLEKEKSGISMEELMEFGVGKVRLGLIEGDLENGTLLAGQIAGMIKEIKPVKVIMEEMVAEAEAIITQLRNSAGVS
ncbi:MAG: enoyl-[acyl-carrier-protein] reductase FabK [Dehalococcoidia bacterium]|nr:MAG: enoyl-[acyl-carrier-protein] reductase FabK [Dehalococcoidia bacterium]